MAIIGNIPYFQTHVCVDDISNAPDNPNQRIKAGIQTPGSGTWADLQVRWIDMTTHVTGFISYRHWSKCGVQPVGPKGAYLFANGFRWSLKVEQRGVCTAGHLPWAVSQHDYDIPNCIISCPYRSTACCRWPISLATLDALRSNSFKLSQ